MTPRTFEDAYDLLCGDWLGTGSSRKVFACRINPDLVVKVEQNHGEYRNFRNILEHDFWQRFRDVEVVAKWLAPIEHLSPDGRILLMKRAEIVGNAERPKLLPAFLSDLKLENFGRIDDRIVCVDYPFQLIDASTRLRKVDWHDAS